ncbi:MAG: hypothetical protein ABI793_05260 [Flavobacterium sp.]
MKIFNKLVRHLNASRYSDKSFREIWSFFVLTLIDDLNSRDTSMSLTILNVLFQKSHSYSIKTTSLK